MRSTAGTRGGTAARVLRAAGLLASATAAAWCATVLLASPAHADDTTPAAPLGQLVEEVAAPVRPVVDTASRAVGSKAAPTAPVEVTPESAPQPPAEPLAAEPPAAATPDGPVATTTRHVTGTVREVATRATQEAPAPVRDAVAPVERLADDGLASVDRLGERLDATVGSTSTAVGASVRDLVAVVGTVADTAPQLVPAVEGAAPALPRAGSARHGHREPVGPHSVARGDRTPPVATTGVDLAVTDAPVRPQGDPSVGDSGVTPDLELPSYAGAPTAPTSLGSTSAGAAYLLDGPVLGDRALLAPVADRGARPAAEPGRGPGCTPD